MSAVAVTWALSVTAGGPGPKAVLIALAHHADKSGVCFPSQQTIADELEMGVSTVRMHVTALQTKGLIEHARRHRKNGSRTSNEYVLIMGQPPESGANLPPDFSGNQPPESSGYDDLPPDFSGQDESNASENQDNRQNSANQPPESGGPTTFEQSEEGTDKSHAAAAPPTRAPACEDEAKEPPPPSEEPAAAPTEDEDREVALVAMKAAANDAAQRIRDSTLRRRFNGQIRALVKGDDYTVWADVKGNQVPWWDRPRLLNIAIGYFEARDRDKMRYALQLAIQEQYDPLKPRPASSIIPGTENAAVLARGKTSLHEDQPSTQKRVGHLTMANGHDPEAEKRRREAESVEEVERWERDNADEAEKLRNQIAAKYANDPDWKKKGDLALHWHVQGEYRKRIRERISA